MCCFNGPVSEVRKTRILVAPARQEGRQLTVYQNEVSSAVPAGKTNAMILPCPLHRPDSTVELVNLASSTFSFDRLDALFPQFEDDLPESDDAGGFDLFDDGNGNYLAVHQVGAYLISVAPTLADLQRYDPRIFTLSSTLQRAFGERYPAGFGFVICRFNGSINQEAHPIAYVHDRQADGALFVPCLHVHDGEKVAQQERFDHDIYSLNTRDAAVAGKTPDEIVNGFLANYPGAKPNAWHKQERLQRYYAYEQVPSIKEVFHVRLNVPTVTLAETLACAELEAYWPVECRHMRRLRMFDKAPNDDLHFALV